MVEQGVSVWLQRVLMLSLGAGSQGMALFCKFPEPLHHQGASSSFLVLRIRAHETNSHITISRALWGPASSGKEGLRKWLLSYYHGSTLCPLPPCSMSMGLDHYGLRQRAWFLY